MILHVVYIGVAALVFFVGAKYVFTYLAGTSIPVVNKASAAGVNLIGAA